MYTCRYGPHDNDSFSDWRQLVLHEATEHNEILSRIPCPAEGCTKDYAQLKYLITHYNIHSGKKAFCPNCGKGYTDPSRASRCRQSHERHFLCPVHDCDYSNARADLVKQHCKKKHPELGDLTTAQLKPTSAYPISDAQAMFDTTTFSVQSRSTDNFSDADERPAPQLPRPALAQAAEQRRLRRIEELRQSHIALSKLTPDQFDAAIPDYPFKNTRLVSYIQGPSDDYMPSPPTGGSTGSSSGPGTPGLAVAGPFYSSSSASQWFTADMTTSPTSSYATAMDGVSPLSPMSYPAQPMSQPSSSPPGFHSSAGPGFQQYPNLAGYQWNLGQPNIPQQYPEPRYLGNAGEYAVPPFAQYPGGTRLWSSESGPSSSYSSLSNFQGQSRHHRESSM